MHFDFSFLPPLEKFIEDRKVLVPEYIRLMFAGLEWRLRWGEDKRLSGLID